MKRESPARTPQAQAERSPPRAKRQRVSERGSTPAIASNPHSIPAFSGEKDKGKKRDDPVGEPLAGEPAVAESLVPGIPAQESIPVDFTSPIPAPAQKRPRTRAKDPLSDGESESEDPNVVWRSLRPDERPFDHGVRPPEGFDPTIPPGSHITSGTRAKTKSGWVSATRSRKVATAFAAEWRTNRVVKLRIKPERREEAGPGGSKRVIDMTDPEQARTVFPAGKGSALNSAKGSQEVIVHGGFDPSDVEAEYEARTLEPKEYEALRKRPPSEREIDGKKVYAAFSTRAEATSKGKPLKPKPRVMLELPKAEPQAAASGSGSTE